MSLINEVRTNVLALDTSRKSLRKFGLLIACVAIVIASLILWRGAIKNNSCYVYSFGLLFLLSSLLLPSILRPVYKIWMGIAFTLGYIMTRIILTILFYIVLTPISLVMRIFGKSFLSLKIDRKSESYWIKRTDNEKKPEQYKHLY